MSRPVVRAFAVCAVVAAALITWHLREVVVILASAILVSVTMEPLARRMTGRIVSHRMALGLAYAIVVCTGLCATGIIGRALATEMTTLGVDLGSEYASARARWQAGGFLGRLIADHLPASLAQVSTELLHGSSAGMPLHLFSFFAWTMILAVCWSYAGDHMLVLLLSLCPMRIHAKLRSTWVKTFGAASVTLRSSLAESAGLLLLCFCGFHVIGIKYAAASAVIVMLVRLFPFAGAPSAIALSALSGMMIGPGHAAAAAGVTSACVLAFAFTRGLQSSLRAHPFVVALVGVMLLLGTGAGVVLAPIIAAAAQAMMRTLTATYPDAV